MYQVEDEPMETVHLYVVREGPERPSLIPVIISFLTLSILVAIGILTPSQQPEQRASIRVPAVLLPLQTFTASTRVIPTGIKTYPALEAHGELTITNGSIIAEELPKGLLLTSSAGIAVVTDSAVYVPAGSSTGYGAAVVSAHATVPGKEGNIPALSLNTVEGTAIYIQNLSAFTGGQDAYSVHYVTSQDRENAIEKARQVLSLKTIAKLLLQPCHESIEGKSQVSVVWVCQFVTYTLPASMHVIQVHVAGRSLIIAVSYRVHIRPGWVK